MDLYISQNTGNDRKGIVTALPNELRFEEEPNLYPGTVEPLHRENRGANRPSFIAGGTDVETTRPIK
jgi:hypothetical protein